MVAQYAKQLAMVIDSETKRLDNLTSQAIKDKAPQRAKRLLGKLVFINPDAPDIKKYQQSILELNTQTSQASIKP